METHGADHDLTLAARAIDRMADTTDMREFSSAWVDFLFRLERAWEVCQRLAKSTSGHDAQTWLSTMCSLRKKDPLLRYLKQARDAETHVIDATVDAPLRVSVNDRYGRPFRADAVNIGIEGKTLVLDIQSSDIGIDWTGAVVPTDPHLLRFKTRSGWYNPPRQHLGNSIVDMHPVAVAALGLHFYRAALSELNRTPQSR